MPRPRKGFHLYRREGRAGWWGYLSRDERHIPLGEDEAEALARLAQLAGERERSARLAPRPEDVRVVDQAVLVQERAGAAGTPKTAYEHGLNLERVALWLEQQDVTLLSQVTQRHVEDYKVWRRATVGAARINRELDSWKRMHVEAIKDGRGDETALAWFKHLREPRPAPHQRQPSRQELHAFLEAAPLPYRDLFRFILGCGLRDEEVRHLELADLRAGAVLVTPKPGWATKGYRYRTIPTSAETLAAGRAWLAAEASQDKKWIWKVMQRACVAAKVAPMSLHDLRHACASHWLEAGYRLAQISAWLGHADITTTLRYLGIVEAEPVDPEQMPW